MSAERYGGILIRVIVAAVTLLLQPPSVIIISDSIQVEKNKGITIHWTAWTTGLTFLILTCIVVL